MFVTSVIQSRVMWKSESCLRSLIYHHIWKTNPDRTTSFASYKITSHSRNSCIIYPPGRSIYCRTKTVQVLEVHQTRSFVIVERKLKWKIQERNWQKSKSYRTHLNQIEWHDLQLHKPLQIGKGNQITLGRRFHQIIWIMNEKTMRTALQLECNMRRTSLGKCQFQHD